MEKLPSVPSRSEYDPHNTMLALNMAIVSVNRILTTEDRVVLEWEYENIINRLAIGNIKSDPEIKELYDELLSFINGKHIRQEDMRRIRESRRQREQEAYYSAMSEGFESLQAPESGDSLWGLIAGLAVSAVSSVGTGYYDYQAAKEQIHQEISNESWQLTREEIEACNKLQTTLLNSSWTLLSKYHLPNEYRLTHENVREFLSAMNESDSSRRLGRLKFIERKFRAYPPYWYFRANAAMNAGDESECRKCFERFNEMWRPVLNYDPYKLEAVKYEIRELAMKGRSSLENAGKIRELVEVVRDYAPVSDWKSNLLAGMVYFALGDTDEGINCVEYGNVIPRYETEISRAFLALMRKGSNVSALPEKVANLYENLLHALPREQQILKKAEQGNATAQFYLGVIYAIGEGVPLDYREAVKWFRKAAEQGLADSQCYLGYMYEYGKGVKQDKAEAIKWYQKAADQGNIFAQEALQRLR